jgi:putative ABC transport system permease protein
MTPDWPSLVRDRMPDVRDDAVLDELAQHVGDLYSEARADGHSHDEAVAIALAALAQEPTGRFAREVEAAKHALPGRIADRWVAADSPPAPARSRVIADIRRDVAYGLRSLLQSPGYTVVVLLTLALGIGANSAIFAAVDAILLRSLPYANANRLYVPLSVDTSRGDDTDSVSYADYLDWRRETAVFEAVALWRPITVDLTGAGQPERIHAAQVAPEFFSVMTVTPHHGRTLQAPDHEAKAPRVAVLSYRLWQRTFGGDGGIIGKTIRIGGFPCEVIGVLPARASWPEDAEIFVPLKGALWSDDVRTRRDNLIFNSIARLRDGVRVERADAVLATIAARVANEHPESRKGWTNRLQPLRAYMVDANIRRALWVLLAAVAAVLAIGCANIAHLGLVRGLGRAREFGVRLALGASRWRLVRQLIVECALLGTAGALAGVGLAAWMIKALVAMAPDGTPFVDRIGLDAHVLAATLVFTLVSVAVAGVLPAVASSRVQPAPALKDGAPAAGSSRSSGRLRDLLIAAEIAAAVVLVTAASLLLHSFWRIQHVEPGVDVDRVLMASVTLPGSRYQTAERSAAFFAALTDKLDASPGVESAAATSFVPVGGGGFGLGRSFLAEGAPEPPAGPDTSAQWNVVTPDYFRTVGIPILQGRGFTRDDKASSVPVAIVSLSFAAKMFRGENPLGRRVRSWRDENVLREIVGVVGEVRYTGLDEREVIRQVYVPHTQNSWNLMNIVVRSSTGAPGSLESTLRRELASLDRDLAVSNIATLRDVAGKSVAAARYTTTLLTLLATTALLLGAIGIYGVISHGVSMRRRELGLRTALGASPRSIYLLIMTHGLRLTLAGLAVGVAASFAVARLLRALLFETEAHDPATYAITVATIAMTAAAACFVPARRATRIDPLIALKIE